MFKQIKRVAVCIVCGLCCMILSIVNVFAYNYTSSLFCNGSDGRLNLRDESLTRVISSYPNGTRVLADLTVDPIRGYVPVLVESDGATGWMHSKYLAIGPTQARLDYSEASFDGVQLPLSGNITMKQLYKGDSHKGVDLVSTDRAILAVASGTVVDCAEGYNQGVGNYVIIQHNGGWTSLYYHLNCFFVEKGQFVAQGEQIGVMGNMGHCVSKGGDGTHLHFMICDGWYGTIWKTQNKHHVDPGTVISGL